MTAFLGFPADATRFLAELAADNSVEFFEANKQRWHGSLLDPGRALVDALGPRLRALDPEVNWAAKVNGSIFTIRRDTRFSSDKRPYKEELGLRFWHGDDRKACRPSFHMRVTENFVGFGAGVWNFEPAELVRFRAAVADDSHGPRLEEAMEGLRHNHCAWQRNEYKRVPAPYAKDHPRGDLLRQRGLAVGLDLPLPPELAGPEFVDLCVAQFAKLAPVHQWLAGALRP